MNINLGKIDLKGKKELIFIILVVLATLFFSKKIWDNQNKKLSIIKDEINNYKQKIEIGSEINKLSTGFKQFEDVSWSKSESVFIMGKINELASEYEIEILNFNPGDRRYEKNYNTFSMSLNIKADYANLLRFLSAIEKLDALTKIKNLQITPEWGFGSQDEGPLARVNLTIEAFILQK